MNDFDRDYENPKLDDLRFNRRVKLTAGIAMVIILGMIVLDLMDYIGKWG